jgi:hypothetical protein
MGFASRDSNAAQGAHGEWVLIIYDEASGVADEIRDSMEGALGYETARELAIGNPTGESGFFRDAFERQQEYWHQINISALDLPNVRRRKTIVRGMTGHQWVDRIRKMFGEKSPYWICRVLGRFASFADQKVLTMEAIRAAQARWDATPVSRPRIMGVDIAGTGDDRTAIALLDGRRLRVIDKFQEPDPMAQARRIVDTAQDYGIDALHMDATSLGWALFGKVKELCEERGCTFDLVDVVLGRAATERLIYTRLLDEVWFAARERLDPNNPECVAVDPDDDELAQQLNVRGWRLDDRQRIKIETKKELRRRGAGSPDVGDAAMLALYQPQSTEVFLMVVGNEAA